MIEFPIQCACGRENRLHEEFITNRIVVKCECGTTFDMDKDEWFEIARDMGKVTR